MSRKNRMPARSERRVYTEDFKRQAVQMLLDGHSAQSIAERLGITGTNLLYHWNQLAVSLETKAA